MNMVQFGIKMAFVKVRQNGLNLTNFDERFFFGMAWHGFDKILLRTLPFSLRIREVCDELVTHKKMFVTNVDFFVMNVDFFVINKVQNCFEFDTDSSRNKSSLRNE